MHWSSSVVFTPAFAFDSATLAWVAAVVANGGTVSVARETIVDALIVGLKADGLFTKLDRLWLYAAENQPSALTDLIATSLSTAINSPTFTTDSGYVSSGNTQVIDTGFNPATAGGQYTLNSAMVTVWANTNAGGSAFIGSFDGADFIEIFDDGSEWFSVVNTNNIDVTGSNRLAGLIQASRTGAGAITLYRNGASIGTGTLASTAIPSLVLYTLGRNSSGSISNATANGAMAAIGGGFSGADATNFYNRIRTYMTAVGVP